MTDDSVHICSLPDKGFVEVRGKDAAKFLQAQLSQKIDSNERRSVLAGWHDASGRVRALFEVLFHRDAWLLVTQHSMLDRLVRELGLFILRSEVAIAKLEDWSAHAIVGPADAWLAERGIALGHMVGDAFVDGDVIWTRQGQELVRCMGPTASLESIAGAANADQDVGIAAEMLLGLPAITSETTGKYVPQMLNLERLGAVAFDKGCFPGQEVIARTQNLGVVKRRARLFQSRAPSVGVGESILDSAGTEVGEVVRAAQRDSGTLLLAVVRLNALAGPLALESDRGKALAHVPLPEHIETQAANAG